MRRERTRFKIRLKFGSSKKRTSKATKIHRKTNSLQSVINNKKLTPVHVSLTHLHPTKMPDIAKQQYYNLVKSPVLINVIPDGKTTLDTLSPEPTPEREIRKTTRSADMHSPGLRARIQLSPADLGISFRDLDNDPWGYNSKPYPSPGTPDKDENSDSYGWSSQVNKPSFFQDKVDEFRSDTLASCDNEVEAFMTRQHNQVSLNVFTTEQQQHHQRKDLQNVTIPLQPVDIASESADKPSSPVTFFRQDSPVFGGNGIWTNVGSKVLQEGKDLGIKTGRKRGRPRKRLHSSIETSLNNPKNVNNSDKIVTDLTRQESKQENRGIGRKGAIPKKCTKLQVKDSYVENKEDRRKRGRPRKRLHSEETLNKRMNVNNSDKIVTGLSGQESKQENGFVERKDRSVEKNEVQRNRGQPRKRRRLPFSEIELPSQFNSCYLETEQGNIGEGVTTKRSNKEEGIGVIESVETSGSSGSTMQFSEDTTEQKNPEGNSELKECLLLSREGHAHVPGTQTKEAHSVVIDDSSSDDRDFSCELASERADVGNRELKETIMTTPKINKWLSTVKIESSPLIKSLKPNKESDAESLPKTTVFLRDQEVDERCISSKREKNNSCNFSIGQGRKYSVGQELFPTKTLKPMIDVPNCKYRKRKSCEKSTVSMGMSQRPLENVLLISSQGKEVSPEHTNKKMPRLGEPRCGVLNDKLLANKVGNKSFTKASPHNLMDGKICLEPCSPLNSRKTPAIWKTIEGRSSTARSVALPRRSLVLEAIRAKSQVPLKDLVVKCERLVAGKYNILKIPETVGILHPQKKKRIRKKTSKAKDQDMVTENKIPNKKSGKKRKTKPSDNKEKKPRKKRRLTIPEHYKNFKPSQLPTISHTSMRYRVAFTFWPQKFSGALDKINQRLINQNSFWKSLD